MYGFKFNLELICMSDFFQAVMCNFSFLKIAKVQINFQIE